MSANNAKQADILGEPRSSPIQWAPPPASGSAGRYDGKERILILLPGPPHELEAIFEGECMSRLRAKVPPLHIAIAF